MARKLKVKGGVQLQPLIEEINRLKPADNRLASVEALMNYTGVKKTEEGYSKAHEVKFNIIKSALEKGIYGDEFDRALMYHGVPVFELIQKVMARIDQQRELPEEEFQNLPDWSMFKKLYGLILLSIKTQYASKQAEKETKWYKETEGDDTWFVNIETDESAWEIPPGGKEVPNPRLVATEWYKVFDKKTKEGWFVNKKTLESAWELPPGAKEVPNPNAPKESAESAESAEIQALPAEIKKQVRDFKDLFKKIIIGNVSEQGLVSVKKSYMDEVNNAIETAFGPEILRKLQDDSTVYNELFVEYSIIRQGKTTYDDLSRLFAKRFPVKYAKIRLSGKTPSEKLIALFELFEAGIIKDFIALLPGEGSGKCRKCGLKKLKGGVVPEDLNFLQQMTKQSYNLVDPQKDINGWMLKKWTPTMKFWMKGNDVIVGVRGTKTTEDVMTWGTIPLNTLDTTIVYKRDKAAVQQFQQEYPKDEYNYYAVGHSLGGAIIDSLIRAGLIKEAVSYNPAIQYRDINAGLPNRRIYYGNDPLYRLMGWWDRKSEHREAENRTWGEFLSTFTTPGVALEGLSAHNLKNFTGGVKRAKRSKK